MLTHILSKSEVQEALSIRDLTNPKEGPHAMQRLVEDALDALQKLWGCELQLHRKSPIVSVSDNYDRLHYPADGAARDAKYTRYVCDVALLRTQTSAVIPPLLGQIARGEKRASTSSATEEREKRASTSGTLSPPKRSATEEREKRLEENSESGSTNLSPLTSHLNLLLACPGLVYRRDCIDRLHTGEPHQLDLWRIYRGEPLTGVELQQMIRCVVETLLPGRPYRLLSASHPYTTNGLQIDVLDDAAWVEIGECGLALPALLEESGLSVTGSSAYSGLAMGLGLDRILMLRKRIDDIRLLRAKDQRVLSQMLDLALYRPVSSMPSVRRDLSLVLPAETTTEDLGDKVRAILGAEASVVESVEVVAETSYEALPVQAQQRLGILPSQKNVLLRIVLRSLERSLTHEECNGLRDRLYAGLSPNER